ncbi:MAG: hypothetical protein QGG40_21495, partial [Myxococcota bacterium]|nr:hypothetical protein [Myxococcota bacterium]
MILPLASDPRMLESSGDALPRALASWTFSLVIVLGGVGCRTSTELAPIADAGEDVLVNPSDTVLLDASGSRDRDGEVAGYSWLVVSAPPGVSYELTGLAESQAEFTSEAEGTFLLALVVTDDSGLSSPPDLVTVQFSAENQPPVAVIEAGTEGVVGSEVHFDGSGSYDPE